jgi:hypothetical protein
MMVPQVRDIERKHFPGWPRFRDALKTVNAADAITVVRLFTHEGALRNEGSFDGVPPVFDMNLHPVVKEWFLLLVIEELREALDASTKKAILEILGSACAQINELRENHEALSGRLELPAELRYERLLRKLWFTHLEQLGNSWAPKLEIGRSRRMFVEIWATLLANESIRVASLGHTAFLDISNRLLLIMGLWQSAGYHPDVRILMKHTEFGEAQLATIMETGFPTLQEVQGYLGKVPVYPSSIQNPFRRYPIVRVGEWGLLAPLPHLTLQWWDLQNLFDAMECTIANLGERSGAVQFYRALGLVVEEYMRDLLREIASVSEQTEFVAPFNFLPGHESPDGFLHSQDDRTIVFESKCYRVPQKHYETVELGDFLNWFSNLLGANENGRQPLRQGHAFFSEWLASNDAIVRNLKNAVTDKSLYVIVSYEDVPFFVSMKRFRDWYRTKLEKETLELWSKTLVISIRDLEIFAAAARVAGEAEGPPLPFSPSDILSDYLHYQNTAPDAEETSEGKIVKSGLGAWLIGIWPAVSRSEPRTTEESRGRLFQAMHHAGFGCDLVE